MTVSPWLRSRRTRRRAPSYSATGGVSDWIGPAFAGDSVIFSRPVGTPAISWEVAAKRDNVAGSTLQVYVVCAKFS